MKQRYFIRELALTDLEEIWLFTLSEWSVEQADAYTGSILARMNWLADNPSAGKPRDDIKPGYFCFPEGRHLIFYIMTDNTVDVIGIPHQSMDITGHLSE
ncbi:MAG: type II toxin-antitoxin system RelE/ParE family toxin [Halioglobus sp.]|nr:type II toxin-antitoxin system RelE/ParE family toxin [Halioglobus sp.]